MPGGYEWQSLPDRCRQGRRFRQYRSAIIGSDEVGADTNIIKDSGTTAETYGRTSCYHHATNPLAAYEDGYLYVTANNATEPSVMYLRSTDYDVAEQNEKPKPDPNPDDSESGLGSGPNPEDQPNGDSDSGLGGKLKVTSPATAPKTADSLPVTPLGVIVAIALSGLAATVVALRRRVN